jgi:hypoxanthine-guanine phosphoribosyltransferase
MSEEIGEILVQADDLQHRIRAMAEEIARDYEGKDLLLIGVLKGAFLFLADLMRHLDVGCEVDFMAVASYGSSTESSGVVRILKDLDAPLEGRHGSSGPLHRLRDPRQVRHRVRSRLRRALPQPSVRRGVGTDR